VGVFLLGIILVAAMWFRPGSPLHNAYDKIRVGMNVAHVEEVLKRYGLTKYSSYGGTYFSLEAGIERVPFIPADTLMYRDASGETLTIHWLGPWDWDQAQGLSLTGHVVGKEYHSGWWDRLTRMLHW
jgi:hypothetical protein